MQPVIKYLKEKKLVGKRLKMSLTGNKTGELWGNFMPRRREVRNNLTNDLFSLQVFDKSYFNNFDPATEFEKWALVEVSDFEHVPSGFETFTLKSGQYAVFTYKGSGKDNSIFEYIFSTWLPDSGYITDDRPHFEILGDHYKNGDPDSEEEIWIPIKPK